MATAREQPYLQFNFLVDLGDVNRAGFQECSIPGLNKPTEVTLKRGLIGSSYFQQWLNDIRDENQNALRNVVIHLQNEDHTANVQTWKLRRARLVKLESGPLHAEGTEVAMEELTLAYERLEIS